MTEAYVNEYLIYYLIAAHLFLAIIVYDLKNPDKNVFFKHFGKALYIINNYYSRRKNIEKIPSKKEFEEQFYNPIIEKNKTEAQKVNKNIMLDVLQYLILYIKFILFIWWFYLIYMAIANILLFFDETLGD